MTPKEKEALEEIARILKPRVQPERLPIVLGAFMAGHALSLDKSLDEVLPVVAAFTTYYYNEWKKKAGL